MGGTRPRNKQLQLKEIGYLNGRNTVFACFLNKKVILQLPVFKLFVLLMLTFLAILKI